MTFANLDTASVLSDTSYIEHDDNLRVIACDPLISPALLRQMIPLSLTSKRTIAAARHQIAEVLAGFSDKLVVIVGPCSIHNIDEALEYARLLQAEVESLPELIVVMRCYAEKPRTTVGWKGIINDCDLDGSSKINEGLQIFRKLLSDVTGMGLPVGAELLDTISPQFLSDCISWGAIGARTTESQLHRELASGVSFPIGFKNGTDGSVTVAVDAMRSASHPHSFLGVQESGLCAIVKTRGNRDVHVILRGGTRGTNYDNASVREAVAGVEKASTKEHPFLPAVMVDASHANSSKDHRNQPKVVADVCAQLEKGEKGIFGMMLESNLEEGNQKVINGKEGLKRGVSITDACISWEQTLPVLRNLNAAVKARREFNAANKQ